MSGDAQAIADQLIERRYQLRVEFNHGDMKWYAYYAGREQRHLFDDDADWATAADTIAVALALLLSVQPKVDLTKKGEKND